MAKLILSMDGIALKEIPLVKERTTLGRKPGNDIQIDNLAISSHHAVFITILNDTFLEDLDSTNGTFVNGDAITKHFLQNNDVIEIGKYQMTYIGDVSLRPSSADFEKTIVLRRDNLRRTPPPVTNSLPPLQNMPVQPLTFNRQAYAQDLTTSHTPPPASLQRTPAPPFQRLGMGNPPPTQPENRYIAPGQATLSPSLVGRNTLPSAAQDVSPLRVAQRYEPTARPTPPPSPLPLAAIQVLNGASTGRSMDLVKQVTTIGRPGVQVATITRRPEGYFIAHVEGTHLPIINGLSIPRNQAYPLADQDIIELGGVKMDFSIK